MIKDLPPSKTYYRYRSLPCGSPDVMRNRPLNSEEKTGYENQVV